MRRRRHQDDSIRREAQQHQHVPHLPGLRLAVLRVASGHDDRRLRKELRHDQSRHHAPSRAFGANEFEVNVVVIEPMESRVTQRAIAAIRVSAELERGNVRDEYSVGTARE
jgi:hypothetical protein